MKLPLAFLLFSISLPALAEPIRLPLWEGRDMPGPAPLVDGEERDTTDENGMLVAGRRLIRLGHVATPEIEVHLPAADRANGTAVVVCPGGGFHILAWDLEGTEVAQWLNEIGVAAVVLKYRVPTAGHGNEGDIMPKKALGPVVDAQRALSLTRHHSVEWNIDPDRVGILGFSAGGETAALAATAKGNRLYPAEDAADEADCGANFAMLIYPGGLAEQDGSLKKHVRVDATTPPMFLVHAADDRVTPLASSAMFAALKQAGVDAELHIFDEGGHGYGLRPDTAPVSRWTNAAVDWLRGQDLLARPEHAPRTGDPADHLPPWITRLTWFGERPDWRGDGQKIAFVGKIFGEVHEYDLATGGIRSVSDHFFHHGFTRVQYLPNDDLLLVGPSENFDRTDKDDRKRARHEVGRMYLLAHPYDEPPVDLGVEVDEGPAVSRVSRRIAWTHGAQAEISMATIGERNGKPILTDVEKILDLSDFPEGTRMIETQNFLPPDDAAITISSYQDGGSDDTDCYTFDFETGELANHTPGRGFYDEPEGVFPDGESTLVEHASVEESRWPLVDLHRLALDGTGRLERLTWFTEFEGAKASQGVISPDGRRMVFQIGKSGDEAGRGYGFFLHDFAAEQAIRSRRNVAFGKMMAAAHFANEPLSQFSVAWPRASLADAAEAQQAFVAGQLGQKSFAGIKGAVVGQQGQDFFGIDGPLTAVLFREGWHEASARPDIPIRKDAEPGVETELGIILDQSIKEPVDSVDELRSKVRAVVPVIELPAGRHDWPEKPTAADLVAANVDSDHYIVGDPFPDREIDLDALPIRLVSGDAVLNETTGGDAAGGQWRNFLLQVNEAFARGYELKAGDLVITGALGKIVRHGPGHYRADYGDVGSIEFSLSPE